MALTTGDKVPSCTLSVMGESGPAPLSTDDLFGGKRVLLFALPGAFTPGLPWLTYQGTSPMLTRLKQPA